MTRERLIQKEVDNKQAQARDEYAKNKPLYSGDKVKEKVQNIEFRQEQAQESRETKQKNKG